MKKLIVLAGLIVSSVFSLSQAEVRYTITDIGTLGGSLSVASAVNDNGQVVGYSHIPGNSIFHAFLHDGTTMTDLGTLGGSASKAYGINNSGQIVGNSSPGGYVHAFLHDGTTMTNLGTLGGAYSGAFSINNSGQIVGYSDTSVSGTRAFLYDGTSMKDLGTLGGNYSKANDINGNGQVVGYSRTAESTQHAFIYNGTTMKDLGTLGGLESQANGINDSGQVVGYSNVEGTFRAFLYDGTSMKDLGTLGGSGSLANSINDRGQVVGYSRIAASGGLYDPEPEHAFLYDESEGMLDLNNLIASDSGWSSLRRAHDINSSGQIVGYGNIGTGQQHAFLLTPVPRILTPNGDEVLIADKSIIIEWVGFSAMGPNVILEYSDENGIDGTWEIINANTLNDGEYDWTLPELTSEQCLVRISDITNPSNVNDVSDAVFTIFQCQLDSTVDLNNDCRVNIQDFIIMSEGWLDVYGFDDLLVLANDWLKNGNQFDEGI